MRDSWIVTIVISIIVGLLVFVALIVAYAAGANTNSTERAKARIAVCGTLPRTSDVIFCLEHAG